MLIAVTSQIVSASGTPLTGKKVVFSPVPDIYDDGNQVATKVVKVTTDDDGRFITSLWSSPDPYKPARYRVQLPDGSPEFLILVPNYERPTLVELSYLRTLGQIDPCAEELPDGYPPTGNGIVEEALDKQVNQGIANYHSSIVASNYDTKWTADVKYLSREDASKDLATKSEVDETKVAAVQTFATIASLNSTNDGLKRTNTNLSDTSAKVNELEKKVDNIDIPETDLSDYYTKTYIDENFAPIGDYATNDRVDNILAQFPPFIAKYYTKVEIDEKFYPKTYINNNFATKDDLEGIEVPEVPEVDLSDYYTKTEADENFAPAGNYATNDRVDTIVAGGLVELETYYKITDADAKFGTKEELETYYKIDKADAKFSTKDELENELYTENPEINGGRVYATYTDLVSTNSVVNDNTEYRGFLEKVINPPEGDESGYLTENQITALNYLTEERGDEKYYLRGDTLDLGDTRLNVQGVTEQTFGVNDSHHNTVFSVTNDVIFTLSDTIRQGSCFLFTWFGEDAEINLQSSIKFIPNRTKFNGFQGDQITLIKGTSGDGREDVWYVSGSVTSPQAEI